MNNIDVAVLLDSNALSTIETLPVFAARLTQHGQTIHNFDDLKALYEKPYSKDLLKSLCTLPHPTLQKLSVINVAVVGASRRFLAQITRHQNEVKFVSASLQYSDYSEDGQFVVPYGILKHGEKEVAKYIDTCKRNLKAYSDGIQRGIDKDSLGYLMPQALRNVLIISATPYQWKHMIRQRVCRRNTDETRIVMLTIWNGLAAFFPEMFSPETTGPFCMRGICEEGRMSCGEPISPVMTPAQILKTDYPLLFKED